jgi:phosphatidate cytidylyltransferase
MAFNWQTFRTRALTAVVFAAVMLAGLFWNHWSFIVLFSVIHFGCWWEYLKLTEKIQQTHFHPYTKMGWMVLGYGLMLRFCSDEYQLGGYAIRDNLSLPVSAAGFAMILLGIFQKTPVKLKAFGMALLGLVYISVSIGMMVQLSGWRFNYDTGEELFKHYNRYYPALIIFSIWINDTMAYIVGSLIGRTPLSKVSPKKTWEGTIGGVLLAVGVIFLISHIADIPVIEPPLSILIPFVVAIAGTVGDLFESKLKRMAGVKDSGSLMPGHGGFLDRFDSLLFAIPVCWILLMPCLVQC